MHKTLFIYIIYSLLSANFQLLKSQELKLEWYSSSTNSGISIQNSFPRGGPYKGYSKTYFNPSYLVFVHRIANNSKESIELNLSVTDSSIQIPNSRNTFMRLYLPKQRMRIENQDLKSYRLLEDLVRESSLSFNKTLNPGEETLFYSVAFFYQASIGEWSQERGGNRAKIELNEDKLMYSIEPQAKSLPLGTIQRKKLDPKSIFVLDANQNMLMTGKGPGQDGSINPFYGEDSYALVSNLGDYPFSIRIQKEAKVIKIITIQAKEYKKIALYKGNELYVDTNENEETEFRIIYEKMNP